MEMGNQQIMIRTRAVIFDKDGRILVQHHSSSASDFYRLPGGGLRFREKAEDCMVREIREESGLDTRVDRLLWVRDFLDQFPYHSVELFFLATVIAGEFTPNPESEQIELLFITLEDLEKAVFYPETLIPKLKLLRENREWRDENPYIRSAN
jgi:ADP-ribose pyrophosphatase YjhB (NUDIX family)